MAKGSITRSSNAPAFIQEKKTSLLCWVDSFFGFVMGVLFVVICSVVFLCTIQVRKMYGNAPKKDIGTAAHIVALPKPQMEQRYTIQLGDNLWDIAVKEYGDGFNYVDIVNANHLENPSLIFSGNVLIIPRK